MYCICIVVNEFDSNIFYIFNFCQSKDFSCLASVLFNVHLVWLLTEIVSNFDFKSVLLYMFMFACLSSVYSIRFSIFSLFNLLALAHNHSPFVWNSIYNKRIRHWFTLVHILAHRCFHNMISHFLELYFEPNADEIHVQQTIQHIILMYRNMLLCSSEQKLWLVSSKLRKASMNYVDSWILWTLLQHWA